ncbi:MAG: hypothetical protein Q8L55_06880 [Phycisphaerales bacterium]|nr:hypothetical protein [Phycisphaerales bacterium]
MIKFAFATVLAVSSAAFASPVIPGQTDLPASPEAPDGVAGVLVGAPLVSPFNDVNGFFSGTVTSRVYTNDPTNPYGLTGLTFVYEVSSNATSINSLGRFTALGFGGMPTDVSYNPFAGGAITPYQQDRDNTGMVIGWSFGNIPVPGGVGPIGPGQTSSLLVVQVPATQINVSTGNVIDGSIATMDILAPIPTPGAAALLGLGTMAAFRRRR